MKITAPTEKEISMLNISLRMAGVFCPLEAVETILITQSFVKKMGGKFSLKEASEIQSYIQNKYPPKKEMK